MTVSVCAHASLGVCSTLPWHAQCDGWSLSCNVHHVLCMWAKPFPANPRCILGYCSLVFIIRLYLILKACYYSCSWGGGEVNLNSTILESAGPDLTYNTYTLSETYSLHTLHLPPTVWVKYMKLWLHHDVILWTFPTHLVCVNAVKLQSFFLLSYTVSCRLVTKEM